MTIAILAALGAAWLWHVIDLCRSVDVATLPPRAQQRIARRVAASAPADDVSGARPQLRLVEPRAAS